MKSDNEKRMMTILENQERDRKKKEKATTSALIFVFTPFVLIGLLVFLAVINH
jgi:hypothetical protein